MTDWCEVGCVIAVASKYNTAHFISFETPTMNEIIVKTEQSQSKCLDLDSLNSCFFFIRFLFLL